MMINRKLFLIRAALVISALTVGAAAQKKIETGFLNRSLSLKATEYRYVVYVPREFSRSRNYPVILAQHGGDYGSDGSKQTENGLGKAIRLNKVGSSNC